MRRESNLKRLMYLFVSILLLVVLTSCNQSSKPSDVKPKMLNVKLTIQPGVGQVNQPITFAAKVTEGNDKVNDADEVTFEIWRSKDEKHEKVEIKNPKNGIYQLKKSFQQEGTYYIISHVTARGMHNMPKKEFTIGTPSEKEDASSNNSMDGMNMDKGH